ncbi:MAG: response regulator [Trueperaceae bacterium]
MTETKKASILVADDLAGQRLILEMLLSVDGYNVTAVEDGKAALEYLRGNTPDLAILDVKMPYLTGIEVCDRMKRIPRLKHVPVIILTALRDEDTLQRARDSQADDVIMKPLEGKDFRQTVKDMLAKSAGADNEPA